MRRMTVVQLLPELSSGGVERTTLEVAAALAGAGHRSVVVSAGGRLVERLVEQGSEHIRMDIGRKSLASLRHVRALRRLFAALRPDIVHARSRLPAWLAHFALRGMRQGAPHFLTGVHGLNSPGAYSAILTRGERVVCVSETVRAHVLRHWPATPPTRLLVIEPGIDTQVFSAGSPAPEALPLPAAWRGRRILLMPGRGTRLKGHDAAIRLLASVRAAGVDAGLWLLGCVQPGREAYVEELRGLAASAGVADFVEFSAASERIVEAYRGADLVLQLSSRPEAFGRTVVESLAVGTPVIGWDHGGVGELLARHFPQGRVPPGDQAALLATTLGVLSCHERPAAIHPQSLADAQAQTLNVYQSLLA